MLLARAPGLGGRRIVEGMREYGSTAALIEALLGTGSPAPRHTRAWLASPDEERLAADLAWLEQPHHHLLTIDGEDYPPLLARIEDPPPMLFVVGDPGLLWRPQLAVVGSRNPSTAGLTAAREIAAATAAAGLTITSGMAMGIDAAAHEGGLSGPGSSVAVLGTGVDRVYPARNRELARRIAEQGALASQFPLGAEPRAGHFPARNRVISGLSLGTVVVEAGLRSGSLITARLAAEQGREVMAVPGPVRNATSRGCHALIRDGARLVEDAAQVLAEIAPLAGELADELRAAAREADAGQGVDSAPVQPDIPDDPDYTRLLQVLDAQPATLDEIAARTDLTPESVSSMLLIMELRGVVSAAGGGTWIRSHEVGE